MFKKIILSILVGLSCQAVFSQEKTAVDYRAGQTKLVKLGDTSVVKLVGDVFLFHNGAIISCDSAYRYSEKRFEALGKVIINQDSLYIYGDKVIYNGETEVAQVLSQLIKLVDSTATMYTREMFYNTRKKIGYFSGGATIQDGGNLMEAENGTYSTPDRILTLEQHVEMENEEYILKSKSMIYDENRETVFFNTLTNIWNQKGEYLEADKGNYERLPKIYNFEKNSYILTKDQECWSDSLKYFSFINEVELKRNIQINDTTQRVSSFGDYGYFWNKSKDVLLTKNPSSFSYDDQKRDTSYVRADTITVRPYIGRANKFEKSDHIMGPMGILDSLMGQDSLKTAIRDSLQTDKKLRDSIGHGKQLNPTQIASDSSHIEKKIASDSTEKKPVYQIPQYKPLYDDAQLEKMTDKERRRAVKEMDRNKKRFDRELRRLERDEKLLNIIEKEKAAADSLANLNTNKKDSVEKEFEIVEVKNLPDSDDMIVRAFGKAKVFKFDMQSIADTIIVESVDSTTTSIGSPIAWSQENQITAARIRSYVLNGQINRTRMFGNPIMGQLVQDEQFNQMKGDYMDALYRNSEMYKLIVTGNSISRFYRVEVDEKTKEESIVAFITSTSDNMIIDMDSSLVTRIKWVGATETFTYPMNKIPEDTRIIEGFKWTPELRPFKKDVFNRRIRLSVRAEKMLIPKPTFQITKSIMEQRKRLIKEGVWTDRNEKLKINREVLIQQSLDRK